mgnify:CR=1 FL=1|jgi:hypothetical protein
MNHEEILELCASNPEAIIDYIKSLEPASNFSFHLNPPKRPDCSLDLYKADRREEICGYIYNDGRIADPWEAYADGYLAAVKKLIEVAKRNEFMEDTFGYPIFYLFYHYLELRLKRIIRCGEFFITPTHQKQDLSTSHNIVSLWEKCKIILKEIEGWKEYADLSEDIKKDYETIDHFIKEVARDTTSQAFRYPDNFKKQKPFLVDDKEHQFLNVTNLSHVVDWLSYRLDGISMAIAVQLSFYGDEY